MIILSVSSTGDAGDAPSDGSNPKIESESDGSVAPSGRGRSSLSDRRQGTGNAGKREKTEPVPVSPPRQSIISAAHDAEVGSQIKVRFDTGDWFSGIISEVDKQRCVISFRLVFQCWESMYMLSVSEAFTKSGHVNNSETTLVAIMPVGAPKSFA